MPIDMEKFFVVGISTRALFDLEKENQIFIEKGLDAYTKYQIANEKVILKPGTAFGLVKSILNLNTLIPGQQQAEVVIMSQNNHETSLRIFNSIDHYGLDISRGAFTSGVPVAKYLNSFGVDLFLSADETDVKEALQVGIPAGKIYNYSPDLSTPYNQIRIALDGDAVIFSDESELIYKEKGLEAFHEHESRNAMNPLKEGPFAKLIKTLSFIQRKYKGTDSPIRTALVTARNSPSSERVIRTLREWNIRIDETFFLGGISKDRVLKEFQPQIFFDDQDVHCMLASRVVPTAIVPNENLVPIAKRKQKAKKSSSKGNRLKTLVKVTKSDRLKLKGGKKNENI